MSDEETMTVPNTLNVRIAISKGWTWRDVKWFAWHDPKGRLGTPPDYVGTLKGVAGLMKELDETQRWFSWGYNIYTHRYVCIEDDTEVASSPDDRSGDCVGLAYLSVFGKESDG